MRMVKCDFKHSNLANGVRFISRAIAMQHNIRPIHGRRVVTLCLDGDVSVMDGGTSPYSRLQHYQGVQMMQ